MLLSLRGGRGAGRRGLLSCHHSHITGCNPVWPARILQQRRKTRHLRTAPDLRRFGDLSWCRRGSDANRSSTWEEYNFMFRKIKQSNKLGEETLPHTGGQSVWQSLVSSPRVFSSFIHLLNHLIRSAGVLPVDLQLKWYSSGLGLKSWWK